MDASDMMFMSDVNQFWTSLRPVGESNHVLILILITSPRLTELGNDVTRTCYQEIESINKQL